MLFGSFPNLNLYQKPKCQTLQQDKAGEYLYPWQTSIPKWCPYFIENELKLQIFSQCNFVTTLEEVLYAMEMTSIEGMWGNRISDQLKTIKPWAMVVQRSHQCYLNQEICKF